MFMQSAPLTPASSRSGRREAASAALPRQVAALAYRWRTAGTARETHRWIIPTGWPVKDLAPHEAAARQARLAAGVTGRACAAPIGFFVYDKRLRTGMTLACGADVYPVAVEQQQPDWPEKRQRETRWATPTEAARLVCNFDLQKILQSAGRVEKHWMCRS